VIRRIVFTTAVLVFLTCVAIAAEPSPAITDLIWWLPPDTETLTVARPQSDAVKGPLKSLLPVLSGAAAEAYWYDEKFSKVLDAQLHTARAITIVEGRRNCQPPGGEGESVCEGAGLFLFPEPLPDGDALIRALERAGGKNELFEGVHVVSFHETGEPLDAGVFDFFITIPRPDVLVIATNREYLRQVLRRTATREGERALPSSLPEWQWVDTGADYWALRHFRHEHAATDPTSPFMNDGAEGRPWDSDAIGFTASADVACKKVVFYYLSASPRAEELSVRAWWRGASGIKPDVRPIAKNVIRIPFDKLSADQLESISSALLYMLGKEIYGT
jgi:hypothetical protein